VKEEPELCAKRRLRGSNKTRSRLWDQWMDTSWDNDI